MPGAQRETESDYRALWQRLGLSIDWRYTYRTIDELARRTSQLSFLDLYRKGLAYRHQAPAIWCSECRTAIAQADLDDLERESEFVTLAFRLENGEALPIATTRPELLPACVAVFVHPDDERFRELVGQRVSVPLFGQGARAGRRGGRPGKRHRRGDVLHLWRRNRRPWWHTHHLPLGGGHRPGRADDGGRRRRSPGCQSRGAATDHASPGRARPDPRPATSQPNPSASTSAVTRRSSTS